MGLKVDIGYYEQEQENLTFKYSIKEGWDEHPLMNEETVRTFLGSFLFRGEDKEKQFLPLVVRTCSCS